MKSYIFSASWYGCPGISIMPLLTYTYAIIFWQDMQTFKRYQSLTLWPWYWCFKISIRCFGLFNISCNECFLIKRLFVSHIKILAYIHVCVLIYYCDIRNIHPAKQLRPLDWWCPSLSIFWWTSGFAIWSYRLKRFLVLKQIFTFIRASF